MAAYLLKKHGGSMRFIKLMYLSDRKAMELYGFPISGDHYFSMNKGPVLSQTYSLVKDGSENEYSPWESWISDVADHKVEMWRTFSSVDELGELSPAEIESMDIIFGQYGGWDAFRLCDETHRICGEWRDPHGSSIPISLKNIFIALGKLPEAATVMANSINAQNNLDILLSDLR